MIKKSKQPEPVDEVVTKLTVSLLLLLGYYYYILKKFFVIRSAIVLTWSGFLIGWTMHNLSVWIQPMKVFLMMNKEIIRGIWKILHYFYEKTNNYLDEDDSSWDFSTGDAYKSSLRIASCTRNANISCNYERKVNFYSTILPILNFQLIYFKIACTTSRTVFC